MFDPVTRTEHLWFLDTLVAVRVPHSGGEDGISVLEHRAPKDDSPPLHIHVTEDEVFHIIEGRFRFRINDDELTLGAGETLLTPKRIPHTYCVESEGGRWLTVTVRGDFERFVRAISRPATNPELPARRGTPTPEAVAALTETARKFAIEIVGPPLH